MGGRKGGRVEVTWRGDGRVNFRRGFGMYPPYFCFSRSVAGGKGREGGRE